jgi:hypothetical protein
LELKSGSKKGNLRETKHEDSKTKDQRPKTKDQRPKTKDLCSG